MKELIERLEHTDELSGDSVWEVREALKKQLTKIAEHLDTIERLTSEHNELQDTFAVSLLRVKQLEAERDSYQRVGIATMAERDALKEGLDGWHSRFLDCEVERDAWEKNCNDQIDLLNFTANERDALRADAMRYRFIRDGNAYIEPNHYDEDGKVTKEMYMALETGKYYADMRDFDMDIDAAIGEKK